MSEIRIYIFIFGIALLLLVLELIRRKHLREKYAFVWIGLSVLTMMVSAIPGSIEFFAKIFGVYYPPSMAFVIAIGILLMITLMLSVVVSHQTTRIIRAIQELGLLENRIKNLELNHPAKNKPISPKK